MLTQLWYYFIVFIFSFVSLTAYGYPNIQLDGSTLKTANLFFRHGARSPLIPVPKKADFDEITWSEEPGILTKVGKEKMFQLGLVLRERYKDFLSPYYVPGEIQVTTTPLERTSSSAKALLAGLYNTRGYSKWSEDIPATVVPISTDYDVVDKSNVINSPNACPIFKSEQRLAIEAARNQDTGFQDVYSYLSLHAGSKINGMFDVYPTWEILECLAHNDRKLPDWASFVYPTRMSVINAKVLRALITGTKKMIRLTGGPYIGEVHKQFNDAVLNPSKQIKLIIHGGHDFSMTANLAALGILEKTINPGDATILELHKIPFAGYFVQILYLLWTTKSMLAPGPNISVGSTDEKLLYIDSGGSVISTVPVKNCGHPCPLHKFLELTNDVIPKSWDIECVSYH